MEQFFLNTVQNVGFPAAVCFYLMHRVVKCIDKNTTALEALREEIQKLKSSFK